MFLFWVQMFLIVFKNAGVVVVSNFSLFFLLLFSDLVNQKLNLYLCLETTNSCVGRWDIIEVVRRRWEEKREEESLRSKLVLNMIVRISIGIFFTPDFFPATGFFLCQLFWCCLSHDDIFRLSFFICVTFRNEIEHLASAIKRYLDKTLFQLKQMAILFTNFGNQTCKKSPA